MKKSLGVVIGIGMLFVVNAFAADQPHSARQQIQTVLNEMLRLANAHDTDRFIAFICTVHRLST